MATLFRLISGFFKAIWSALSFFRALVFNLLFLALLAVLAFSFFDTGKPGISDNTILKLSIAGDIVEQRSQSELLGDYAGRLLGLYEEPGETVLQDILDAINQAQDDPRISAVLLDLKNMGAAELNQLAAIGSALEAFRKSGKPIVSAEDYLSQTQYYLASHADTLFLNPMGGVNLHGFGLYRFYVKDALEKLKVNFHVFQVGSYKSALEPITRNSMSAEDRSQSRAWLSALWDSYTADVARQRQLKPADIDDYINSIPANLQRAGGDTARLALDHKLVDQLKTRAEVRSYLSALGDADEQGHTNMVSLNQYLSEVEPSHQQSDGSGDRIGLIIAQGTITGGQSQPGTIGAETVSQELRQALEDDRIKAVVLRIDSGGGSAFASEVIRQEILSLKQSGKPVLVSMGAYAASGGYWIAADADEIWAAPTTLTGSIGIFMALPTFEDVMAAAGVHRDGVGTTNLASGIDLSRPLSEEIRGALTLTLQNGYDRFISIVAEGRGLDRRQVEELAQGKVYAGARARELGLVDQLGSLAQAIEAAAERAGLDEYSVSTIREPQVWWDRVLAAGAAQFRSLLAAAAGQTRFLHTVQPLLGAVQSFLIFPDPNGMYAHSMLNLTL